MPLMILILLWLSACSLAPQRNPVPHDLADQAIIHSIPEARFWADEWPQYSIKYFEETSDQALQLKFPAIYHQEHHYLAISGGGSNGAFGAGLLVGWSESGTRPEFTMVTGVSTGALTAPFAFLGPKYDATLTKLYTTLETKDVVRQKGLLAAVFSDSVATSEPLRHLLETYIDEKMIQAIAVQHHRGRRLFIGTVNLDAGRAVIWNIGAIAASDYERKLELIHDILQASTAIPVAFPPVKIPVEVNGQAYDEIHVDGGTGSQVFIYPASVDWQKIMRRLKVKGQPKAYVIRNAKISSQYHKTKMSILPIANRSIDSLIRTQGIGDIYQIYALCQRDGLDFNLAYIPDEFDVEPQEEFDPNYMHQLYRLAYELARKGYPWHKTPPGFQIR